MTNTVTQPSAEILQFPTARVRRAAQGYRNDFTADARKPYAAQPSSGQPSSGSWYHEEAIATARREREH